MKKSTALIRPCTTRWSTWNNCLESLLKSKDCIIYLTVKYSDEMNEKDLLPIKSKYN